jgi:ATP-dependent DNA helicase RecG
MRLKALVDTDSGFKLAEKDLEIRGPGDFIGIRQSGIADLAMKSLGNVELIEKTRKAAKEIIEKDHDLRNHPVLREKADIFQKRIHLE